MLQYIKFIYKEYRMKRIDDIANYTLAELKELAADMGITEFPLAKNISKPNKQEVANVINAVIDNTNQPKTLTPEERKRNKVKDAKRRLKELQAYQRVVVTESYKPEEYENDDSNRVKFVTWGNRYGHHTTRIVFGVPWICPKGAIANLEKATYRPVSNKGMKAIVGEPQPAYKVAYLPLPTKEELEEIAKAQALRKAQGV
jgi:anion-transporting  ArsA/GET3 family ATPase